MESLPLLEQLQLYLADWPILHTVIMLLLLIVLSWVVLPLARRWAVVGVRSMVRRSGSRWGGHLIEHNVFDRLSWAVPLIVFQQGLRFVPGLSEEFTAFLVRLALALLVVVGVRAFSALLAAVNAIYNSYPVARNRPISSYLQVVTIVAHLFGLILIIATLIGQSPWFFLSGLGAMMAVILLVFRDTLLSLVAGIQLVNNNLIRIGDWIEMPQFGADGDVIDISLHAIRVQNWDRTITTIPTHKFLDHSFKNWRGMQDSGGRRIKRALNIDLTTVRFLTEAEIARFEKFVLLHDYIREKRGELAEYNRNHGFDQSYVANARRLTNIGTLRAYIINYLRQRSDIRQDMTFLVRQLEPTPQGLPLELYVFCADIRWPVYEGIQSDIFDHILSIVPEFGLRVFQQPSGNDFQAALRAGGSEPTGEQP